MSEKTPAISVFTQRFTDFRPQFFFKQKHIC